MKERASRLLTIFKPRLPGIAHSTAHRLDDAAGRPPLRLEPRPTWKTQGEPANFAWNSCKIPYDERWSTLAKVLP